MLTAVGVEAAKKASIVSLLLFNWATATLDVHKANAKLGEKVEAAPDEGDDEGDVAVDEPDEEPVQGVEGKKVLIVATSATAMGDHATGAWLEEIAAPYNLFREAGCDVTIASLGGGAVPIDAGSLVAPYYTEDCKRFQEDPAATAAVTESVELGAFCEAEGGAQLKALDCVFLAGGHGACVDFAEGMVPDAVTQVAAAGGVVAAVCHGNVGLVAALAGEEPLVKGKKVAAFSNAEEEAVQLHEKVPYLLEDKLKELGAEVQNGEAWSAVSVTDGKLVTGQNPQSSELCARNAMLAMLA